MTCTEMAFFPQNFTLQNPQEDDDHQPPTSLPHILPQDYHGVGSFLGKRSMSFTGGINDVYHEETNNNNNTNNNGEEELSEDEGSQAGEKKKRLNMEQVRTLEKNFELGNKLEPERKMQLARALGLQPRQIAIWFQNRRARWKTKQLEKDYDVLKRQFDAIKAENEALHSHNKKLQSQIMALKNREPTESTFNLNIKETEGCSSNRSSENNSDIKLDISMTPPPIDSPSLSTHHHHQTTSSRPFFPPSTRPTSAGPTAVQHLFHNSSRTDQTVKEESLCNMFCGIDDQTAFWPWLDQPHFN